MNGRGLPSHLVPPCDGMAGSMAPSPASYCNPSTIIGGPSIRRTHNPQFLMIDSGPQLQPRCTGRPVQWRSRIKVTEEASWQRATFRTRQSLGRNLFGMADDRRFRQCVA